MVGKRVWVPFSAAALISALIEKHGIAIRSGRGIGLDCYRLFPGAHPFSWRNVFHYLISRASLFHQNRTARWCALVAGLNPDVLSRISHSDAWVLHLFVKAEKP